MAGAVSEAGIHVKGLRQLDQAFGRISKDLQGTVRETLAAAVEPVRVEAENLARENITNIMRGRETHWYRMRTGVTPRSIYVAPATRRARGHRNLARPNLAPLLAVQMEDALDDHVQEVTLGLEAAIDALGTRNGF